MRIYHFVTCRDAGCDCGTGWSAWQLTQEGFDFLCYLAQLSVRRHNARCLECSLEQHLAYAESGERWASDNRRDLWDKSQAEHLAMAITLREVLVAACEHGDCPEALEGPLDDLAHFIALADLDRDGRVS